MELQVDITFRATEERDLENLEWFGLFRDHRELIRKAFDRQTKGENFMLLALYNDLPVGQCWIDLKKRASDNAGVIWALRVIPWLQGNGIGSRLIRMGEAELFRRDYATAEIHVEKDNRSAELLYQRLGYVRRGETRGDYSYRTPEGVLVEVPSEEWVYGKALEPERNPRKIISRDLTVSPTIQRPLPSPSAFRRR